MAAIRPLSIARVCVRAPSGVASGPGSAGPHHRCACTAPHQTAPLNLRQTAQLSLRARERVHLSGGEYSTYRRILHIYLR